MAVFSRTHLAHDSRGPYQIRESIGLGGQRPAVVDHLLQELVARAEVVLHCALVGRLAEVQDERVGYPVKELDHEQGSRADGPPGGRDGGEVRQAVAQDRVEVDRGVVRRVGYLHLFVCQMHRRSCPQASVSVQAPQAKNKQCETSSEEDPSSDRTNQSSFSFLTTGGTES